MLAGASGAALTGLLCGRPIIALLNNNNAGDKAGMSGDGVRVNVNITWTMLTRIGHQAQHCQGCCTRITDISNDMAYCLADSWRDKEQQY